MLRERTSAEGKLGVLDHGVALVENDELEARAASVAHVALGEESKGVAARLRRGRRRGRKGTPEDALRAGKVLNAVADDVNPALVRGVELECHVLVAVAVYLARDGEDGGRFPSPRGPIEEQVRESILFG